ncbi:tubulin-like doman-containing protein [Candidatus Halobonum tyrrellensis]|uniref:Tubulin like n=1 Tax=Candidatus Halobonum tyrrellensis G22 TaxID=1324957 RepID=V4H9W1_9EURY|nr:tubulin-like doman-containing protein [Candidatus Halobonum tyrrellensis]ESP86808.1 hypothetical protein K933_17032 [Candidatus Halobonum tyrrellensis G22]
MNLPDQIFTIGGAGKDIGIELLESEWLLRDILKPRPEPESITVTIIDTSSEEKNSDLERIRQIRSKRDKLKAELRDTSQGRVGDVDIRYKLVTENIMLNSRIDLTGDDVVPRITSGNGMRRGDWWLEDSHIEENLNFAKGAVRKRGLGKAMFYKAYAEDDELATMIDIPSKGEVAVIAGLGGGTGSGVFGDVAHELAEKMPTADITLFGVLPNHTEGLRENANAFAALSELERLSLEGEEIFKDRIVMPIDPTGFDGKRGNRVESDQLLEEFDEAAVYLIAAYYNNQGMEDVFEGSPQFAPFTIGIPQVLRYNVEAIQQARADFQEILDQKSKALEAESDIYEEVELFLERHYDLNETGLRGEEETDVQDRLAVIESLLTYDLFDELDYESVEIFREVLNDAKSETEDVEDQIEIISGSLRAGVATPRGDTNYADNVDAHLAEILKQDLASLARRKQLLDWKSAIGNNRIRRTVEHLVGAEEGGTSAGGTIRRLEADLEDAEERRERTSEELQSTTHELEQLRDEQAEQIESEVTRWHHDIEAELEQLQAIDVARVEQQLAQLETALSGFMGEVTNAESKEEVSNISSSEITDHLDEIERMVERFGLRIDEEKQDINRSLSELKNAREAFLTLNQEESTIERITPWKSTTEETRQDANKTYRMASNRLDDAGVFTVGPPSDTFTAELEFSVAPIVRDVDEQRQELQQAIVGGLREKLDDSPSEQNLDDLRRELTSSEIDVEACSAIVRQMFERELEGTDDLESRRVTLQERLETVDEEIDLYEATIDLFEAVSNRRRTLEEYETSFHKQLDEFGDETGGSVASGSDDYVFVKSIQPEQVFQATGSETLAETGLLTGAGERHRVRDALEELANNTLDRKYTGLQRRKLSQNGRRYEGMRVRVAVMSQAIDQIKGDDINLKSTYREAFDLEGSPTRQRYSAWNPELGNDWDIGLGVFIDGVFLDNIRKVVQADGYAAGYAEWANAQDVDIRIHHSLWLDKGRYVYRNGTLNVEAAENVEFFLQDESSVVNQLLEEYSDTVVFGVDAVDESADPAADKRGDRTAEPAAETEEEGK